MGTELRDLNAPATDPLPEALHRILAAGRTDATRWGTDACTNSRGGLCVPRSIVPVQFDKNTDLKAGG